MIEFDVLITYGHVDRESLEGREERGWTFLMTIPAKQIHPSASEYDMATIWSKYVPYSKEESDDHAHLPNQG